MSIQGISAVTSSPTVSPVQGGFRSAMEQALGAVASKLGMSVTDLRAQLHSGKSLADVASANGISGTDLLATIKAALTGSGATGATSSLSGNALDALANRIANHKGGHHHHGGGTQGVQGASGTPGTGAASGASGTDADGDNDGSKGPGGR
jgi:hypothetical protein